MTELLNKIYDFEDSLNNSELFRKMNNSFKLVLENKELVEKIKEYNKNNNIKLREDIYKYEEIKNYKKYETDVNLIIMEINSKLKLISNDRSCAHENN